MGAGAGKWGSVRVWVGGTGSASGVQRQREAAQNMRGGGRRQQRGREEGDGLTGVGGRPKGKKKIKR